MGLFARIRLLLRMLVVGLFLPFAQMGCTSKVHMDDDHLGLMATFKIRWATCLAFAPDGATLAIGTAHRELEPEDEWDSTGEVEIWDVGLAKRRSVLEMRSCAVCRVCFSPCGKVLAVTRARTVMLWDTTTWREIGTRADNENLAGDVVFSHDGKWLAWSDHLRGGLVRLWDRVKNTEGCTLKHPGAIGGLTFAPDSKRIASIGAEGTMKIWDAETGKQLVSVQAPLEDRDPWFTCIVFSPDGHYIATGGSDNAIRLWDSKTGKECAIYRGHGKVPVAMAFDLEGKMLASGSDGGRTQSRGGEIKLWDVRTGRELVSMWDRGNPVFDVAFSPSGKTLATLHRGAQGCVKLWDVAILLGIEKGKQ
jgi:WD40 repeat protein